MLENNFWQDKNKSQKIIKEKKLYENLINSYDKSVIDIAELSYELIKSSYSFFSLIIFCELGLSCQKLFSNIFCLFFSNLE